MIIIHYISCGVGFYPESKKTRISKPEKYLSNIRQVAKKKDFFGGMAIKALLPPEI